MEWGFIILMVLAVPIVIIWPLLIWAGVFRGLYKLVRNRVPGKENVHQAVTAAQKSNKR